MARVVSTVQHVFLEEPLTEKCSQVQAVPSPTLVAELDVRAPAKKGNKRKTEVDKREIREKLKTKTKNEQDKTCILYTYTVYIFIYII